MIKQQSYLFDKPIKECIEHMLPKKKVLSQQWASLPDWYGNTKQESDCETFVCEKIANWQKRISEIEEYLKSNRTKEAFQSIKRLTNISKTTPMLKRLKMGEMIITD